MYKDPQSVIVTRVDRSLYEEVKAIARKERTSVTKQMNKFLSREINRYHTDCVSESVYNED